ncbi:hybrid sensor histidine kinase/response regulator [candidate division KSB3 bacterium]|uniref:histidine kinase n=1 Tax=candidate division KSB3 bacterium TaxID=2044937 RepID=A0A2G6E2F6_9BACT|nr:MAG: hybrid sensor histidine kinase/response regulator [candidate division KSB3 bacterium]PIE28852.1 MAG: hybrid sensor histidine kinase/response regulator [candidate division KSB3 bacterium]
MSRETVASILIVEDNPPNISMLFDLLNESNFEVLVALDGESALQMAAETRPDLILLDVMLGGIDGFETCRRLKASQATHEIPIIFMTAIIGTTEKVKGFNLGAVDYITKPFEPEEVMSRVRTHLLIQHLQNNLQRNNADLSASLERERELNLLKSRFISIASHELRTPLSAIRFSTDLLRRYAQMGCGQEAVENMLEEVESIDTALEQMVETLDEVLTLSRSEAGQFPFFPLTLNVSELCYGIVEGFKLGTNDGHDIVFHSETDAIVADVDPKLMENILSNLLSNAIKYSPEGGIVDISLQCQNNGFLLVVEDQGIGIAEEDQHRLFDAFYRASNVQGISGTGLGLSIVKQFVELHGGTIRLESRLHEGSRFLVSFPFNAKNGVKESSSSSAKP